MSSSCQSDEIHQFLAADDEPLGFMCAVLDKELRVTVHGEQHPDQVLRSDRSYSSFPENSVCSVFPW